MGRRRAEDAVRIASFHSYLDIRYSPQCVAVGCRFINMFISTWTLLVAGLVFALPMIHLRVKNHTELADETLCVNTTTLLALRLKSNLIL